MTADKQDSREITKKNEGVEETSSKVADNMIITSNAPTTLKECRKLYNNNFLSKRYRNHFITIPKTTLKQEEILETLKELKQVTYIKIAKEHHKDKTIHYHIIIQCKDKQSIRQIHEKLEELEGDVIGTINYQQTRNIEASLNYLNKEGETIEYGELKLRGKGRKLENFIQTAEDGDIEEAIQQYKERYANDYIKHKETIENNIQSLGKPKRKKFEVPDTSDAELREWQSELYEKLQKNPKARQLFWIKGDYGVGKSFMLNYLADNYEYGVFSAGQCCSLDNLAYKYDEEGAIVWDLPRNFNWSEMTEPLCNVVEKFTDFGQTISSMKYKGKTQKIRGHVIIFSNENCPDVLKHRDVVEIYASNNKPKVEPKVEPEVKPEIKEEEVKEYLKENNIELNWQAPQFGKYIKISKKLPKTVRYYTEEEIRGQIEYKKNLYKEDKENRTVNIEDTEIIYDYEI